MHNKVTVFSIRIGFWLDASRTINKDFKYSKEGKIKNIEQNRSYIMNGDHVASCQRYINSNHFYLHQIVLENFNCKEWIYKDIKIDAVDLQIEFQLSILST